jgi:nucleotide-binding universal stress UspA family protein
MFACKSIVCATDLSGPSDDAVAQAAAMARAHGAKLTVVNVFTFAFGGGGGAPMPPLPPIIDTEAVNKRVDAEVRAQIARVAKGTDAAVEVRIDVGPAFGVICEYAESKRADLIVVGSRGATGLRRLALGSVAENVVRHASCPVLVARPSQTTGHVLVATDLSDPSLAAISAADAEAQRRKAKLTVLHCMDFPPTMMAMGFAPLVPLPPEHPDSRVAQAKKAEVQVREALARLGVKADVVVDQGSARTAIPSVAEQLPAELVVVGTRGRTGFKRLLLGGVAESVVRHAPCSVLAMRKASVAST